MPGYWAPVANVKNEKLLLVQGPGNEVCVRTVRDRLLVAAEVSSHRSSWLFILLSLWQSRIAEL